jgi:hypothetical protein
MTIVKNNSYKFTEEEQQALVTVHDMLYKLWRVATDSEEQEDYSNAYCVVDSLCEDIPSYIWNPDEKMEDNEE